MFMDNSGSPEAAELSSEELELLAALFAADEQAQTTGPTSALRQTVEQLPLSFGQKRLWFLDQLEPGNPAYNIPFALRLHGPLIPVALEWSLNEVIRRHEVLRTTFTQQEDQLFQVIAPEQAVSIEQVDLRGSTDEDRQAQIRSLAEASELHGFSLARGPLLKATLARLDEEEWAFFLNIHHIVFDGWSIALFTHEIIACYEAYQTSQPVDLPALPIQYADYAIWQQQQTQAERFEQHLAYWREQLANLPVLNLPTDEPRPSRRTSSGGAVPVTIEASLYRQLTALSQQSGCTLFMTLLAAWQVLLARYSSQLDIAVGSPVAGRLHSETEPLIGFFVNTLVLRTDLTGNPSTRTLLEQVRRTTLTAFDHQMVPFDRLVEELQPERSLSHTPLVQTMFTLQNFGAETINAAGLAISPLVFESKIAKFDLMLTLSEHPDGLNGELEYSTDLYRSPTIERMIGHFHTLLTAICANPDQPIMSLPLLTATEREQLLATWNTTAVTYPQVPSLVALIEAQVERTPDAVAVEFEQTRLSYRELDRRANQLAHHLRQLGVGPDVRVGVCVERSLEMVVVLLGVLKAGGAYIPLDPEYPAERLHYMLEHSQAAVLLTQQSLAHQLPGAAHVICLDAEWETIARQPATPPDSAVQPDNLAYVIYTSGSTGLPKGVMITHRSLINHMQWMIEAFPLSENDRVLQKTPFSFDASVWEFYAPLLTGARLVMARPGGHQEIDYLIETITSRGVTTLQVVPSVLKVLLEHGLDTCASLTRVFCGGEALAGELADRFFERMSADLINLYGPTEATIETLTWQCSSDQRRQAIPIGRPISNVQAYILDAHQHLVPIGVPGELYLGGVSLARGYLNRADVTAEKFVPDPFSGEIGSRLYRTGDLARYREHGVIEYLGRIDYQVKLRGFRIELGEIEAVLRQHEAVRDALVLPQNERLVAYVVEENQEPRTKNQEDEGEAGSKFLVLGSAELRQHLGQRLPEYMIPAVFVSLPELPLTPNGKLDRAALPRPEDQPGDRDAAYVAPSTELEQNLATIWQAVLNVEQIGIHDSFFDRGGHSLLATQVVSRLRDTMEIELPLRALFETPTIAGMSRRIEAARQADPQDLMPPLQRVPRDGRLPLSFAQQRLWFLDQLEPGNPFYNIHTALEVTGPLDRRAVEQSLNALVMRHEALRTTFAMRDDQPVQVIAPALSIELPIVDLRDLPEAVRASEALRLAAEEAGQPFDLQDGPVLRARLLWLDRERHIMLLTMHHIVSDGWSMGVLVRELFACYLAYSAPGAEQIETSAAVLPPLPIQYADFAAWQRQWLQGAVLEAQIDYWKRQLANLPVLELPTDRPRPPVLSFQGATQSFMLPRELTSALLRVSQQLDATLFMTLLTAFQIVLSRYSGQTDLAVGSPIANRTRRELEDLIGFFVNMLVLRTDLGGAPTIRQLVARVRATCLDAYAHQDLPFEQLVEELQPERSLSYNPLFQVGFALQNAPLDLMELPDLRLRPINVVQRTSTFDLSVFMSEEPDGIQGLLEYNTDLFDDATITRLVGHFSTVLAAIAADPDRPVAELPLLTKTEHEQLADWNATAAPVAQQWVHERFEAQALQTPDAVALIAGERRMTYAALSRRSSRLAHYLRALGAGPGARIGLYIDRSHELVIGLLGILKAGAAYVPLDPEYPRERLEFMRDDAGIAILVTQESLRHQLAAPAVRVVCLDSDAAEIDAQPEQSPALAIPPDTLAYVIYTSGSTGLPKGVMVEHGQLANTLGASQAAFGFRPDDRMPCIASFSFDIAIFELFCPLLAGGSAVLTTKQQILDLPGFARTLETVTVLHTLPSLMRQIAGFIRDNKLHDRYASMRQVFVGGDAVAPDLLAEIQTAFPSARINVLYGPTEATIICATHPVAAGEIAGKHLIGKPMSNTALRLYDRSGQLVPVGVPGELYIGGASVTRGYLQREALTAEKFVTIDGQRWYRSGDLARFLPDGTLEFLGRIDQQVKIRGFRIELGEIEALLNEHPDVRDSVVLPRNDAPSAGGYPDTRLVGYVVPAASSPAHTAAQSAYVDDWQTLYDETYAEESLDDPTFHIVGWHSSYTGQPFPPAEMRAWRDATVDRIRELAPQRILEIGVGTGLLLFPLAGTCAAYHGIDFSAPALAHIRRYLPPEWTHVTLAQRRADELGDLPPGAFDTVIINSVAQYFPSVDYLVQVISQAVALLAPGGHLFVGDIRSQPLLQSFATAIVLARATPDTSRETAWSLVEQQVSQERELLLDPAFFHALRQHLPRISDVQVEIKRGQDHNELTQFRYDVTLTVDGTPAAPQPSRQHHWLDESWTIERLATALGDFDGESLLIRSIPSARLYALVQAAALLHDPSGPRTVNDLHAELGRGATDPIDPETLWSLGAERGYQVRVGWHENGAGGYYDAVFSRTGSAYLPPVSIQTVQPWSAYATAPAATRATAELAPQLRQYLKTRLPEHMIPAAFVALETLPLTPNGKVDRTALPAPRWGSLTDLSPESLPRTPAETLLADIWRQVLGLPAVGIHQNFFDLGGHSLLATQVMSRVRTVFGVNLPVRTLFEQPTIALLSRVVTDAQREAQALPPLPPLTPTATPADALPLSFAQQRLWFIEQLEPGTASYHVPGAWAIQGPIDYAAFQASLDLVVARHASLRTTFAQIDGQPVQRIAPPHSVPITRIDLTAVSGDAQHEVQRLIQDATTRPFDLVTGPLLRVSLIQLAPDTHVFVLILHHIITDGWSMGVLINELATAYIRTIRHQPLELPALPVQYPDYAVWQRTWLDPAIPDGMLAAQLAYWQRQLGGVPTLDLPTDHLRPPVESHRGATVPVALDRALVEQLTALSRQQGTTLFMTLLTGWYVLLARYSGQSDIAVGTPIAGRTQPETEPLIGFFINTLVLRTSLAGRPTFRELLDRVRTTTLDAYAHQDAPFESVVERLQPERDRSRQPLFQVLFALMNAPLPEIRLPEIQLTPLEFDHTTSVFDLSLLLFDEAAGVTGHVEYATDLFDATTISRMMEQYQVVLSAMAASPDLPVARVALLTETERRQVLIDWNRSEIEYPREAAVHQLIEQQAARTPNTPAIVFEGASLSYAELNARSNQLAHHLRAQGVGPDVLVALMVERGLDMIVGMLAILKAGGAYLPLDPAYPAERLQYMLGHSCAAVILTQAALVEKLPAHQAQVFRLDADWPTLADQPTTNPARTVLPDHLAYIIYTSGSTGRPKGVMVKQQGLINLVYGLKDYFDDPAVTTTGLITSISFDISVNQIFPTLFFGRTLHIIADDVKFNSRALLRYLDDQQIHLLDAVPSYLQAVLKDVAPAQPPNALRYLLIGGEKLEQRLVQAVYEQLGTAVEIINIYGLTEITDLNIIGPIRVQDIGQPITVGRPLQNNRIYILDAFDQPQPVGIAGEVCVSGESVSRGYLFRPELTAERFVACPFEDGQIMVRTGDLGRWRADGTVEILGRSDQQVKLRGFRIELGEIEALLARHPAVRETAVLVREDMPGDQRLVAYVVENGEQTETELPPRLPQWERGAGGEGLSSLLRAFLQNQLPKYMVPGAFVLLDALPRTPNGKLNRNALPAPDREQAGSDHNLGLPRTPAEELIAGIWASVLGLEHVSIHDNFFALGGHSLLATQVVTRLRETFQVDLPLRSLFETPTVAGLAEAVQSAHATTGLVHMPPISRVARDQPLPLSFAQQRLWFLDQLDPDKPFYNIPVALRLSGVLNVAALERSLAAIVERHESLRTTFPLVDGQPIQQIEPYVAMTLPIIDLRSLPADECETQARQIMWTEAQQPFNLSSGPLLRALLVQLGETDWIMLLTIHHIVSDGWSMGVLVRDLIAWYTACSRTDALDGADALLPDLPIQYADFAVQQRDWLTGAVLDAQLAYWMQHLGGELPLLELPTDRPRPATQSFQGATYNFLLPKSLSQALTALSQREGVTLFMTLLAAWQTLLYRYTAQDDILIGSPIANRTRQEIEGLIGFFVNTLVLRTDLSGQPTFRELLQRVREVTLGAYMHQDLPFEYLVEALHPNRDLSRQPIVQVMFGLQNAPMPPLSVDDLTCTPLDFVSDTAKFDLSLFMWEQEDGLSGTLEYATDLFDADRINRLADHFGTLLAACVAQPDQSITTLPLLTPAEHTQRAVWNTTELPVPAGCVHERFAAQATATPAATALICGTTSLTYGALYARANQLAHYLRAHGVGPEVRVGVCVERSPELVVALLGVLLAGGAYVPLDPTYPAERLRFMLADSQAQLLITQQSVRSTLQTSPAAVVCIDTDWPAIQRCPSVHPRTGVQPENLAYLIYTSGSTGTPKAVLVQHQSVVHNLCWRQTTWPLTSTDRVLQTVSFSFDPSVWGFFWPLGVGAQVVLVRDGEHHDSRALVQLLKRHNVTMFSTTPSLHRVLLDDPDFATCTSLRQVVTGGDVMVSEVQRRFFELFDADLINAYGPTETTIDATSWVCRRDDRADTVPIGYPVGNAQVYLVDAAMQLVPVGVPGELYVGGAGVTRGYHRHAALTAERFVPDPFTRTPGARLYRTGDLARHRADGAIEFLGRIDHQIKLRGFRIELGEIATALADHELVHEALVVAHTLAPGDMRLVGYVVPALPHATSPTEPADDLTFHAAADLTPRLHEYLQARLPEYMVPAALIVLDAFPLTPNGKVDRAALPAPSWGSLTDLSPESLPRTPAETLLADIWRQVLGLPAVGIHQNFFDLGGHSLLATQVMSRVRTVFGVNLPVRTLFEQPTIALLSRVVTDAQREAQALPPLPPLTPTAAPADALPLSFAQQRLWFIEQLEPGTASYHVPGAWAIQGPIDYAAFQASLDLVIARHASLRTTFTQIDDQPVQRIAPPHSVPITRIDLTAAADAQHEVQRLIQDATTRPFDLVTGPLLRASLIQLAPDTHVFVLILHHIITDGWSMGVLVHELATAYIRTIRHQPLELPALPVQYPDYAVWQRTWLDPAIPDGMLAAQLAYWQRQLGGVPTLDLPTDHLRPPVESHRGAMLPIALDRALMEPLTALSRQQGTTLFMTLLTGWYVLLARYSGQDDIAVGTPIAGRTQPETEPLIGFFINTLVLRTSLAGSPTFRELLDRVRTTTLDAYAHQDAPFEQVVERLQPERDRSRQPLFQVLFALMNASLPEIRLPEIQLTPLDMENTTSKFDLSLLLFDEASGVTGHVEYATDLFDATTISRMMEQYQVVLSAMAASPDLPVARVALLGEAERHQLTAWNASARPYPRDAAVHQLIEQQAARTPDVPAIVFEGASLSYAELNARSNQLAHHLHAQGVGPDVLVALMVERGLDMIVGMLAILKAGGAYVPLDPAYPAERLQYMLSHSRAAVILTQAALVEKLPAHQAQVFRLDADWPTLADQPTTNPARTVLPDHLAYIIFTSGSTGRPKGVMVKQQGLINLVYGLKDYFDDPAVTTTGLITSISFDISVNQIFPTLFFGRTLHIIADDVKFNSRALLRYLDDQQIHLLDAVPSYLQAVLKDVAPEQPPNALRYLLIGGEKLEQRLLQAVFGQLGAAVAIVNIYGLTEISDINILGVIRAEDVDKPITAGQPLQNNRIYILDAFDQPQPVGIAGEICVSGDSVSRGYLFRPELTAERFVACPFEDGQIMVRTGDLGRWRADGTVEILGRSDQQVKLRGFRIELGEIEALLARHPAVRETAVLVREDTPGDQRLVAYVVENLEPRTKNLEDSAEPGSRFLVLGSALRTFLQNQLPKYMVPGAFVLLDALPRTPNGKLNRNALPAPDREQAGSAQAYVGPRSVLELQLVQIWEELLQTTPIGVTDNFFDLGGHSLNAIRLVAQIQKQLGPNLPLAALFEAATIEQLAELVRRQAEPSVATLVSIRATGSKPPFFCIHPAGGDVLCYRDLAMRLDADQPFYGLQAAGLYGEQAPDTTIEAMATRYLAAIQDQQPQGPYYLGGWSLGGLVAVEVARQIQQQGQVVAALVLIDSNFTQPGAQSTQLDLLADFALQLGLTEEQLAFLQDDELMEQELETAFVYALERLRQANALPAELTAAQLHDRFEVFRAHTEAMNIYQPRPFGDQITVIQSQYGSKHADLAAAWAPLVDSVTFHRMPGTHFTMIREPHVAELAGLLTDSLARPSSAATDS